MSRISKSIETESRWVPRAGRIEDKWGMTAIGNGVSFRGDENVLKLIVVTDDQLCEYTEDKWLIHVKYVNCVASESFLNKDEG